MQTCRQNNQNRWWEWLALSIAVYSISQNCIKHLAVEITRLMAQVQLGGVQYAKFFLLPINEETTRNVQSSVSNNVQIIVHCPLTEDMFIIIVSSFQINTFIQQGCITF